MPCTNCGSTELENNYVTGNLLCMGCGMVVSMNCDTAEVEFVEEAGGNKALGKFFSDQTKSESLSLKAAKERISGLCANMNLYGLQERASNFYISALRRGITRGRRTEEVACACIYLAYRTTEDPCFSLCLLDFSDHVPINVFRLGHTYLSMKQRLHVESIHDIDPYLYVEPFARQLEFGEHTMAVCETASLILKRMRKDWMCTGRRPAGVAASAILIAARIHQFNRTYEDVSKIARISRNTTRKRLVEFFSSEVAAETIDNLHAINDFEAEQDPPCFKNGLLRAQQAAEIDKRSDDLNEEMIELERRINAEIEKLQMRSFSLQKGWQESILSDAFEPAISSKDEDNMRSECEDAPSDILRHALDGVVDEGAINEHVQDLHDVIRTADSKTEYFDSSQHVNVNSESVVADGEEENKSKLYEREDQQLDLTGIDDDELEREYILSKPEAVAKIRTWIEDNADYLVEEKKKQEKKRKKEEEDAKAPPRKKRSVQKLSRIKGNSPGEILKKAMELRGNNKIDYNAFSNLEALEELAAPNFEEMMSHSTSKEEEKPTTFKEIESVSPVSRPSKSQSKSSRKTESVIQKKEPVPFVSPSLPSRKQKVTPSQNSQASLPNSVHQTPTVVPHETDVVDLDEDEELEDEEAAMEESFDMEEMMNAQYEDMNFTEEFL